MIKHWKAVFSWHSALTAFPKPCKWNGLCIFMIILTSRKQPKVFGRRLLSYFCTQLAKFNCPLELRLKGSLGSVVFSLPDSIVWGSTLERCSYGQWVHRHNSIWNSKVIPVKVRSQWTNFLNSRISHSLSEFCTTIIIYYHLLTTYQNIRQTLRKKITLSIELSDTSRNKIVTRKQNRQTKIPKPQRTGETAD